MCYRLCNILSFRWRINTKRTHTVCITVNSTDLDILVSRVADQNIPHCWDYPRHQTTQAAIHTQKSATSSNYHQRRTQKCIATSKCTNPSIINCRKKGCVKKTQLKWIQAKTVQINIRTPDFLLSSSFKITSICTFRKHFKGITAHAKNKSNARSLYQRRVEFSSKLSASDRVIRCLLVIEPWMLCLYRRQTSELYCLLKQVTKQLKSTHTGTQKLHVLKWNNIIYKLLPVISAEYRLRGSNAP